MTPSPDDDHELLVGVISDTHGHFPQQAADAFQNADLIIHAGDFNTPAVYEAFKQLGPLRAVRGNTDHAPILQQLPKTEVVQVAGVFIYIVHDLLDLEIDPRAAGFQVVVHGHLHIPEIRQRSGVLYLNPGSPVSPRGGSKPGAALLKIRGNQAQAELFSF